jgi:8-oxo-dGTP pyrophosphatase MutT (NUDIX family)
MSYHDESLSPGSESRSHGFDWENLQAEWAGRRMQFVPDSVPAGAKVRYVVVLIGDEQGRFLLAHIAERGYCAPSGHIEPGEAAEHAAIREAYEEAGAVIRCLEAIGYYRLQPCSPAVSSSQEARTGDEGAECIAPVFLAQLERLEPVPHGSESRGVRWATLKEMPQLYYQWSPLLEAVFRYARARIEQASDERQD